jgi:hypothetical protein
MPRPLWSVRTGFLDEGHVAVAVRCVKDAASLKGSAALDSTSPFAGFSCNYDSSPPAAAFTLGGGNPAAAGAKHHAREGTPLAPPAATFALAQQNAHQGGCMSQSLYDANHTIYNDVHANAHDNYALKMTMNAMALQHDKINGAANDLRVSTALAEERRRSDALLAEAKRAIDVSQQQRDREYTFMFDKCMSAKQVGPTEAAVAEPTPVGASMAAPAARPSVPSTSVPDLSARERKVHLALKLMRSPITDKADLGLGMLRRLCPESSLPALAKLHVLVAGGELDWEEALALLMVGTRSRTRALGCTQRTYAFALPVSHNHAAVKMNAAPQQDLCDTCEPPPKRQRLADTED